MDDAPLPESFAALAGLADGEPTIAQAVKLTQLLNDVPALQRWLREQRGSTVCALRNVGHSREELARHLGCTEQRVGDICAGHRRSRTPRRAVRTPE